MSLEGKANRLASMIRGNLSLAMQGLSVVPMFAGFDVDTGSGRIFSYDVTGGCYEEHDHHSVGSGSLFARGSLKKLWHPGLPADDAVRVVIVTGTLPGFSACAWTVSLPPCCGGSVAAVGRRVENFGEPSSGKPPTR